MNRVLVILLAAFVSGFSSLLHESVWIRGLGFVLGNSSVAATVVIGAFVGGLGLGSWFLPPRLRNRPLGYLKLQLLIAALGVAIPYLALEGQTGWPGGRLDFFLGFGLVFLPGFLIGGSFPLLFSLFGAEVDRKRSGLIYGINTLGAVLGAALGGYLGVALLGLKLTGLAASGLNVLLGLLVFTRFRRDPGTAQPEENFAEARTGKPRLAAALFVIGFLTLGHQILVARALMLFFDGFALVYSAVLAVFLFGLAMGAFLVAHKPRPGKDPQRLLGRLLLVSGWGILATLVLAEWAGTNASWWGTSSGSFWYYFRIFAVTALFALPATLALGALTPVSYAILGGGSVPRASAVGFWTSLGSLAAPALVGQFLIPWAGLSGSFFWLAMPALLMGTGILFRTGSHLAPAGLLPLGLVLLPGLTGPFLAKSWKFRFKPELELLAYADGRDFAVAVAEDYRMGSRTLFTDSFRAAGTGENYRYMRGLGHLPLLLHPDPRRVAVICHGTGTTGGAVASHPEVEEIQLVEISPEVVGFSSFFQDRNAPLFDGNQLDPRARFILDDGRRFLRETEQDFDLITLEPLLPNTPAAVHFYTQEFYQLVKKRLAPGGLLCQWIPTQALPLQDFQRLVYTFFREFPGGSLWLLGDMTVLVSALDSSMNPAELAVEPEWLRQMGFSGREEFLASCLSLDGKYLRGGEEEILGDDRPALEWFGYRTPLEIFSYLPENLTWLTGLEDGGSDPGWIPKDVRQDKFTLIRGRTSLAWDRVQSRGGEIPERTQANSPGYVFRAVAKRQGFQEAKRWEDFHKGLFFFRQGVKQLSNGKIEEAQTSLDVATSPQSHSFEYWLALGAAQKAAGSDQPGARESLIRAFLLFPRLEESPEFTYLITLVPGLADLEEEKAAAAELRNATEQFRWSRLPLILQSPSKENRMIFWILSLRQRDQVREGVKGLLTKYAKDGFGTNFGFRTVKRRLAQFGEEGLILSLAKMYLASGNPKVRVFAAELFGELFGRAGLEELVRMLDDGTQEVRRAAILALFRRTQLSFDFDFRRGKEDREESLKKWRRWLAEEN